MGQRLIHKNGISLMEQVRATVLEELGPGPHEVSGIIRNGEK